MTRKDYLRECIEEAIERNKRYIGLLLKATMEKR